MSYTATQTFPLVPKNNVDLSLSQKVSLTYGGGVLAASGGSALGAVAATTGTPVTIQLTAATRATVASTASAKGVTVAYTLPSNLTFLSSNGTYNPTTGLWTIGAVSGSTTLTILARVNGTVGGTVTSAGQINPGTNSDGTAQVDVVPANNATNLSFPITAPVTGVFLSECRRQRAGCGPERPAGQYPGLPRHQLPWRVDVVSGGKHPDRCAGAIQP